MANMDLPPLNVDAGPKFGSDSMNNPITRVWRRRKLFWPIFGLIFAASVGVASNLAALRALATDGIQRGHMALHARAVAADAWIASDTAGLADVIARFVS